MAGPPYVTDDPEPTDFGRWEIYGFGSGTLYRRGSDGEGGLDINYGGARDLQLSAVLSLDYSHNPGLRTQVAQKDMGKWALFGGGGWTLNPGTGNRNYGFGGVALTRTVTKRLSLGVEVYHQTADSIDARTSTGLRLGATRGIARKWSLIGSAGPLVQNRSTAGRYAAYVALEFHN